MTLSNDFQSEANTETNPSGEPMFSGFNRFAAGVALAVTALVSTGCAIPVNRNGNIAVRAAADATNGQTYPIRRGFGGWMKEKLNDGACSFGSMIGNPQCVTTEDRNRSNQQFDRNGVQRLPAPPGYE